MSDDAVQPPAPPARTALITGATRGIGRAIADALAPDFRLIVGGSDPRGAAEAAARYPDARPFAADLADEGQVRAAIGRLGPLPRLDVLVHSAGVDSRGPLLDAERAEWRRVFEINVIAVADLTRALLPPLRAARGLVVAINSGAGLRSGRDLGVYAASKFALRAWADALRQELRGSVRVTSIHPGRVATDMQRAAQRHLGRAWDPGEHLPPADVARAVRFAATMPPSASLDAIELRPA